MKMMYGKKDTPCDYGECPYNAIGGDDCRYWCGLGVDEDSYPWEDPNFDEWEDD
jgi:hypothetical protein